jgi:arginine deiminase
MIQVVSEVGRLRSVIIHPPGPALERMLPEHIEPSSPSYLLFDDLVDVRAAADEHEQLCDVLASVADVIQFQDLLSETLADGARARTLCRDVAHHEGLSGAQQSKLESLSPAELAASLVVGTVGGTVSGEPLFAPAPNLIFTRDLAAVVGKTIVVGNANKAARRRETMLAWTVFEGNKRFSEAGIARSSTRVHEAGGSAPLTIEGGDVLVVSPGLAVIGASERTSWAMIIRLATELLEGGLAQVLVVEMPKQRSSMHLDTVFTMTDRDACVVYPPLLESGGPEEAKVLSIRRADGHTIVEDLDQDLISAFRSAGHPLNAVQCGGGHPIHARREQWTDGANYVALGPGVVVGYARNHRTAVAMGEAGFEILSPSGYLAMLGADFGGDVDALFESGRRIAVHLVGSELSRGRGGPRCLTCPVWRAP